MGPASEWSTHHEQGVPFPIAETLAIMVSVKRRIGSELAMAHDHDHKNCVADVSPARLINHRRPPVERNNRNKKWD